MRDSKEKVIIIGSGAAGLTAAIYAARANLKPLVIEGIQPGGQLTITTDVENYPGYADVVQGPWMMEQMRLQAEKVGARIISDIVTSVDFKKNNKIINLDSGKTLETQTVIITTGAQAKWLGLKSENDFNGKGVSACATCDGFFYKEKEVAVVGGGNTAVEEALYLSNIASKVTLIHRRDKFRAEAILVDKIYEKVKEGKIVLELHKTLEEVIGDDSGVTAIKIKDVNSSEVKEISLLGVFIAIGHKPNTSLFEKQLNMENGYIITEYGRDGNFTQTSIPGIFAAGDVQDHVYRQAITSAGTGCMAALDAERFLSKNE